MTISSLVIVLDGTTGAPPPALDHLDGLTLGPATDGGRLPAVLEAASPAAAEQAVRRLAGLPGVGDVEIVYVDFRDDEPEPSPTEGSAPLADPPQESR